MRKILFLIFITIIPVFAYEVYNSENYKYEQKSDKLLFILDYSKSMSEYLGNKTKAVQVMEMMNYILPKISEHTLTGLRVYGHTCGLTAFNACRSSELLVPIGKNNISFIKSELSGLKPKGMTPITYSLKQAVKKDLSIYDGTKHIVLLTDGGENCDESPCDYSIELMKTRRDIKIDVIAFDVDDEDDLAQLRCTADVTGGKFTEVNTRADLFKAMENTILQHKNVDAIILR